MLFRSLAIGLLGACLMLLATRPLVHLHHVRPEPPACASFEGRASSTIIDVAPAVTAPQLESLLRLGPGERIASVDDVPVVSELGAGLQLGILQLRSRRFLDLDIESPAGSRRILVLLH